MNAHFITYDELPYQGKKLLFAFSGRKRRKILDRMAENMQKANCAHLQLCYLTTAIVEIDQEERNDIPEGADPDLAHRVLEQVRRGDFLTSEEYIAQLGGL